MPERSGRLGLLGEEDGGGGAQCVAMAMRPPQTKASSCNCCAPTCPLFSFLLLVFFNFSFCFSKKKQLRVEVENDQRMSGKKGEMGARNGATNSKQACFLPSLRKYLFYLLRVIIKCAPRRLIGIDCVNKFIVDNKCLITPTPDSRRLTAWHGFKWQVWQVATGQVSASSRRLVPTQAEPQRKIHLRSRNILQQFPARAAGTLNAINRIDAIANCDRSHAILCFLCEVKCVLKIFLGN